MSANSIPYAPANHGGRHGSGSAGAVVGGTSSGGGSSGRSTQTVHLHRFVALNDRLDTHIFTFIVPAHLYLGYIHEVYTKEFVYANQHWNLKLIRSDRHIGAFLNLRNALSGMLVRLDYSFVVINREHFTRNENISEREAEFTAELPSRGRSALIEVSDLAARNFIFDDYVFLLELQLKSPLSLFRDDLTVPREFTRDVAHRRLESSFFNFGSCDWNLCLEMTETGGTALLLSRHSRFEHWCRITYRVIFSTTGDQKGRQIDSGIIEHLMDVDGYGRSYPLEENVFRLINPKGQLHMEIKMLAMNPMAIVELVPTSRSKNLARFYDCDKKEWLIESDILGKLVKFRLFYADIHNVPPYYARLIAFKVYIVPYNRNHSLVRGISSVYCCFYTQKEIDDGFEVSMNLPVEEVCDTNAGYVHPQQGSLTIQIEWVYNHLLCYDQYHYYDNISRLHKHQMSREILALQAENYALEKQVHNYQVNLSSRTDIEQVGLGTPSSVMPSQPIPQSNPSHQSSRGYSNSEKSIPRGSPYTSPPAVMDGSGYGSQPLPSNMNQQERLRRSLPNAPSPQHRRPASQPDINGPGSGAGIRVSHSPSYSTTSYNSPGRVASPVGRRSSSSSGQQRNYNYSKQQQRNGRTGYEENPGQYRRREERW